MWCLARLLPFMIGNDVPVGDEHWNIFLELMSITDVVFAPVINEGLAEYLGMLVADYLEGFKELYPDKRIIPKQHFMVHYPRIMIDIGPLVRHWCMRFEAKHNYFKKLANGMFNFKNIALSLANRHQKLQCHWLSQEGGFLRSTMEVGPGKAIILLDLQRTYQTMLRNLCGPLQEDSVISKPSWIQVYGTKLRINDVVVTRVQDNVPEFNKIKMILVLPLETVVFLCKKYLVLRNVHHLGAYEVALLNEDALLKLDSLCDFHPLDEYNITFEGQKRRFIRLKYLLL